jgi:hypothetical protein
MASGYTGPSSQALRESLTALLSEGLGVSGVAEHGGALLELRMVIDRLPADIADDDGREVASAVALTEVLEEAVVKPRIPRRKHRVILKYVLPLELDFRGKSIKERRAAAGAHIFDGKKVKANTVRTYPEYEPNALDELARALTEMEAEYRRETLA